VTKGRQNAMHISGRIMDEISKVVIGKDEAKELLLVALLSQWHVLIEGLTGTAKTTLARTFALVIGGEFKRIQFTPDMLPADVTGFYMYTPDGSSRFMPGPIFANVLLADELNRTTPRTQSALLEAMQENQVTLEGKRHPLPHPFMVIASQLPYGSEGTYPLTEVQADRFMLRIYSGFPSREQEEQIIERIDKIERQDVKAQVTLEEILQMQEATRAVHVSEKVANYITTLVEQTRNDPDVMVGASPRASIALYKGSRALALLHRRDFVTPDDVKQLLLPTLQHRIRVKSEAEMDGITPATIIRRVEQAVPVPKTVD
jgi:MoxR-like ATPase